MDQSPLPQHWSPMISNQEDELANFLDFADLDFSAFNETAGIETQEDGAATTDESVGDATSMLGLEQQGQFPQMKQCPWTPGSTANPFQNSFNLGAEIFSQQGQDVVQTQQQYFSMPNLVPPTPNSVEMHGRQVQYPQPRIGQQQQMYEQYRRFQRDQMNFTPLVSPAVTPLDTQLRYPDYATPSDCFSPLTSPALQAQNHASVYSNVRNSDTSDTTSPVDTSVDYNTPALCTSANSLRKSRRKASISSNKNPARSVRQSPAMKPQSRKRQASNTVIPPKEVANIIEEARKSHDTSKKPARLNGKLQISSSQESSGADSVSPEPSLEALMPPPATPRSNSAGKSPHLNAKRSEARTRRDQLGEPATPASLMRIRKQTEKVKSNQSETSRSQGQVSSAGADLDYIIEDTVPLESPTSSGKELASRTTDTFRTDTGQSTPSGSEPKKTRKVPTSRSSAVPDSNLPKSSVVPSASPDDAAQSKHRDLRTKPPEPKRHNSNTNEKASPALRPRISPSIKPLLPEGVTVSPETSALLLASKSNYQNILEGTHFPGVSYPENLSTNLTSKRTSHKIAEQGRRNRINTALQEIASLLPPTTPPSNAINETDGREGDGGARGAGLLTGTPQQQSNSKASTVEAAIEYIKSLQKEVKECKEKIQQYESENLAVAQNQEHGGHDDD